MSRQAPDRVFLDPRVAFRLPQSRPDAAEPMAGGTAPPVGYIREDIYTEKIREAANVDQEVIVQIQAVGDILYGLSTLGRLWAHGVPIGTNDPAVWHLITDRGLEP